MWAPLSKSLYLVVLLTVLLFLIFSCNRKENSNDNTSTTTQQSGKASAAESKPAFTAVSEEDKIKKGKTLFMSNCISCHNMNPEKDGAVGPAIKGSPFELIKARVQKQSYPPGYKPKRQTKIMPKLPLTDQQISYIAAFLKN